MFFQPVEYHFPEEELNKSFDVSEISAHAKAYSEGYKRGLTWPDMWESHGKPGGPATYPVRHCNYCNGRGCNRKISPKFTCKEWMAFVHNSQIINQMWCNGWADGHAEKIRSGKKNPV